ncbi:MAG: translation initiation factor IF-3 [Candidatus Saccharibacteria bacterium]
MRLRRSRISKSIRINQEIRAEQLRVIGASGEQLGIMSLSEALKIAEEAGVDLIEISPSANPPVVKVVDWGKYQYQKMKEQQKNRKNTKTVELKQMRMGLKIGSNDLEIKLRKIREFLADGHKVKITVIFRGREMAHQELGYEMMNKIIAKLEEESILEQKPIMAGRNLSITVRSK